MFWEVTPVYRVELKIYRRTTDNGVGKRSQAGLCLFEHIASSAGGFRTILSRALDAHERSLSFTYGKPEESCILVNEGQAK